MLRWKSILKPGGVTPRLETDEQVSQIERWQKSVSDKHRYRRLYWTRRTTEVVQQCSPEAILKVILPKLEELAQDRDNEIRGNVALQLGDLCGVLATRESRRKRGKGKPSSNANNLLSESERNQVDEHGRNHMERRMYSQIRKGCLPILRTLISYTIPGTKITNNGAIRRAASESLIKAADSLDPKDLGGVALKLIISLGLEDSNAGNACISAYLLARLSKILPEVIVSEFVLPQLRGLADHSLPGVRLCAASQFGSVARAIRNRTILREQLAPSFRDLCSDSLPAVRQACVYAFVEVVQAVGGHERPLPSGAVSEEEFADGPGEGSSAATAFEAAPVQPDLAPPSGRTRASSVVAHHAAVHSEQTLRIRADLGIGLYKSFSVDEDLLVRTAALQELGKLVWVLGPRCVPLWLVERFCRIPSLPETEFADTESMQLTWLHCAWTFPAVARTLLLPQRTPAPLNSQSDWDNRLEELDSSDPPEEALPGPTSTDRYGDTLGELVDVKHARGPVLDDDGPRRMELVDSESENDPNPESPSPEPRVSPEFPEHKEPRILVWKHVLLPCLQQLVSARAPAAVRKSIACSFHELSTSLDQSTCASDLLPLALRLCRDPDPHVRACFVDRQHLFLRGCGPRSRLVYLRELERIADGQAFPRHSPSSTSSSWQPRLAVAQQLPDLMLHCYPPVLTTTRLARLTFLFSQDPVAEIRHVTAPTVAILIRRALDLEPLLQEQLTQLQSMVQEYRERFGAELQQFEAELRVEEEAADTNPPGSPRSQNLRESPLHSPSPLLSFQEEESTIGLNDRAQSQLLDSNGPSLRLGDDSTKQQLQQREPPSVSDPALQVFLYPLVQYEQQRSIRNTLQRALQRSAEGELLRKEWWIRESELDSGTKFPVSVLEPLLACIVELSRARSFRDRQQFLMICRHLMDVLPVETYEARLIPELVRLVADPVVNVRLQLATIAKELGRHETFIHILPLMVLRGELVNDQDPDVAEASCVTVSEVVHKSPESAPKPWIAAPATKPANQRSQKSVAEAVAREEEGSPSWIKHHRHNLISGTTADWDRLRQRRRRDIMLRRLDQESASPTPESDAEEIRRLEQEVPAFQNSESAADLEYLDYHYEFDMSVSRAPDVLWTEQLSSSPVPRSFPWEAMGRVESLGIRRTVRMGLATLLQLQERPLEEPPSSSEEDSPQEDSEEEDVVLDEPQAADQSKAKDSPPPAGAAEPSQEVLDDAQPALEQPEAGDAAEAPDEEADLEEAEATPPSSIAIPASIPQRKPRRRSVYLDLDDEKSDRPIRRSNSNSELHQAACGADLPHGPASVPDSLRLGGALAGLDLDSSPRMEPMSPQQPVMDDLALSGEEVQAVLAWTDLDESDLDPMHASAAQE